MDLEFEIAACHGDHAGKAHVAVIHLKGGAEIAILGLPFDADLKESQVEEQARILADAARVVRRVADFLQSESMQVRDWPARRPSPGHALGRRSAA
jgi:hypothetical protein